MKAPDYKSSTAFETIPYQAVSQKNQVTRNDDKKMNTTQYKPEFTQRNQGN